MNEAAFDSDGQARVTSDRMITLFVERAVPAIRHGHPFQTWALDAADRDDITYFLGEKPGEVRLCWDDMVIIYQVADDALCHVRADPVAPDHVVEQLDHWSKATWPPFMRRAPGSDTVSREYIGPHPQGGFTNILVSFVTDPEDEQHCQAHLSVAWITGVDA